jgi:hypothetical protein
MIKSLEDAQGWYEAVRKLVEMMDRIARRYWKEDIEEKTLKETLYKDAHFKEFEAETIQDLAQLVLKDLDDLAVLLLFSVFEANVRDRTLEEMALELVTPPSHPTLVKAVDDAKEAVENGSFGRLTEAYKSLDSNLKTQVDQVRRYRNWVAHGRRGIPENNVNPERALKRLGDFLELLDSRAIASSPVALIDPAFGPPVD